MGWGAKKPKVAAPAPQPLKARLDGDVPIDDVERSMAMFHEPAVPVEKPSDAAKAEIAWHQLKSRKGWTDASLVMLMHEFIKSRELFAELTKFVGRR